MLDLMSRNGAMRVKCEVVGYQYPDAEDEHDANWLSVRVEARQGDSSWDNVDPALEAGNLRSIRDWLTCLAEDRLPRRAHLTFLEPCLGLRFIGKEDAGVRIAVHLSAGLRPPPSLGQEQQLEEEQSVELYDDWQIVTVLDQDALQRTLDGVTAAIETYPVRTPR